MAIKKLGKIVCAAALAGAAVCLPLAMTGCTTNHPEAKITIEFNEKEYVLEYKLYRNMYPQTVQHFIELADSGFYDNTIVHDVDSGDARWYCGGYDYVKEMQIDEKTVTYESAIKDNDENTLDYFDGISKEKKYYDLFDEGTLTPSVYRDYQGGYVDALPTLIGEFSSNQHKVDKGALSKAFGSLSMYYTNKNEDKVKEVLGKKYVYLDKYGSEAGVQGTYKYNSATSIFGIQSGTSTSSDSSHCIFGVLKNTDVYTTLVSDVKAKAKTSTTITLYVDTYDRVIGGNVTQDSYTPPSVPVVIKKVKIIRY